ncbi:MAG: hypothetical protein QOE68_4381, partial [Thermoanaerobaculia bacterium]|nr:hypothetical protein [Thermoanaerobaculia bacterium]
MPVIAPPPAGADRQTYYNAAAVDSKIAMLPAAQQGMEIYLDNGAQNDKFDVFSFTDGLLTYDPTTPGILVLHIHPLYVYWLRSNKPPGTSAPQVIRYENVRVATIGPALLLWLKTFYLKALQEGAGLPHETNVDVLAAKYLEQFFLGKVAVWVEGGMKIGEADDLDATHRGIRFLATYNGLSVSIVVLLRELPSYGDPIWSGHPLALAALLEDIPVSIYAQFEVYDVQQKRFIALPAGVTVDLMDSDLLSPDDRLATAVTNASGQVEFVFQDAAAIDDVHGADLFLLVHTNGMAHAAHAALPQEWSTKGWLAVDGTPGYQSDFGGTTLGTADAPLIFRIGVDFHLSIQYIV